MESRKEILFFLVISTEINIRITASYKTAYSFIKFNAITIAMQAPTMDSRDMGKEGSLPKHKSCICYSLHKIFNPAFVPWDADVGYTIPYMRIPVLHTPFKNNIARLFDLFVILVRDVHYL